MSSIRASARVSGSLPVEVSEVEEALVRVHELWRRSPGERRWPFAGDAPWNLMQREAGDIAGGVSETLVTTSSGKVVQALKVETLRPRCSLDTGEVAERDRVTGWLQLLADPRDRRIVWAATAALARGEGRVPWNALRIPVRWMRSPDALALRYRLALARVLCALNGWPQRRARALAGRSCGDADG